MEIHILSQFDKEINKQKWEDFFFLLYSTMIGTFSIKHDIFILLIKYIEIKNYDPHIFMKYNIFLAKQLFLHDKITLNRSNDVNHIITFELWLSYPEQTLT